MDTVSKQETTIFNGFDCQNQVQLKDQKTSNKPILELIHDCVVDYLKGEDLITDDQIDHERPFDSLGVDYQGIDKIKKEIEQQLGRTLKFDSLFYQVNSVNKLYELVLNDARTSVFENEFILPDTNPMDLISVLIGSHSDDNYYVYEKPDDNCWNIALGAQAAITLTPTTLTVNHFNHDDVVRKWAQKGGFSSVARRFINSEGGEGWNVYGQAAFEYAAQVRGIEYAKNTRDDDHLFSLMVPRTEVTLTKKDNNTCITVRARDIEALTKIQTLATAEIPPRPEYQASEINTEVDPDNYQQSINEILDEIRDGHFLKVTFSRQIATPNNINMLGTYLHARPKHTPSRTFLAKFMDHEVLGFSPELVMAVRGRKVCTQPLAGTHILTGNADDDAAIRNELVTDPKEIAEHSMTVVAAVNDIRLVSEKGSEKVDDFMYVSERGNVQHLASMVTGTLSEDKDIWDAFDNLFPSVTACGSPKEKVIKVILRKEKHSRGLYSGAVLMINEKEFEASMVLRSVHQQPGKSWLQAGAGIFELSTPEREFRETSNKLKSLAPHIVFETE